MPTSEERREMIARLRSLPERMESAIAGLNDEQLDTPYREGGWTVRQVVHHVADSHMNAFIRMKLTLTEEHPTVKPYNQDDWATLPDAMLLPPDASLAILRGLHERWSVLLERVPEAVWGRTAYHPENGVMTLEDFLRSYAGHGHHHAVQIEGLRRSKGW